MSADLELRILVERASGGDVEAFTELVRRHQDMAFGYAFSVLRDFHLAQDVTQESFVAAYFGLRKLQDPSKFPGWLRGIVRHQCGRVLRQRRFSIVPLEVASGVAASSAGPHQQVEQRDSLRSLLAFVNSLPQQQREVTVLFYVEDRSQQEIATFLDMPVTTVNNRLHAARRKLREEIIPMAKDAFNRNALPEDFAERIGRIVRARGPVVDVRFEAGKAPEILSALNIEGRTGESGVTLEVVQQLGEGLVRCIPVSSVEDLVAGMRAADTGTPVDAPVDESILPAAVRAIGSRARMLEVLETGIKSIDLLTPLARGGNVGFFGGTGVGRMVLAGELVERLARKNERLVVFLFVRPGEDVSLIQEGLREDEMPYSSESVQAVYLSSEREISPESAILADQLDAGLHFFREFGQEGIWPSIDPLRSYSRLLDPEVVGREHYEVAQGVLGMLRRYNELRGLDADELSSEDEKTLARARRIRNFLSHPYYVAEPFTHIPGEYVNTEETVRSFRAILEGECDDLPADALLMCGTLDQARRKSER